MKKITKKQRKELENTGLLKDGKLTEKATIYLIVFAYQYALSAFNAITDLVKGIENHEEIR